MATAKLSELAFASETTPGTPPANAAAWVTDGTRFRHIPDSLELADVKPAALKDDRSHTHIFDKELNVEGLRNGSFSFQVYLTGSGATTADGNQISTTTLMALLENAMGGLHRSNTTDCAAMGAHSATEIDVTDDTSFAVGGHILWEHPTTGEMYLRQLVENSGGNVWVLDEALPQAANDGDIIHGVATNYPDASVLDDSNASGRQLSMWARKSGSNSEIWEFQGCKLQLSEISLSRGELPTITFECHYASFTAPHESPPQPAWVDDPDGEAPVAVGPDVDVFLQDYGTTTANNACLSEATFSIGLPILRDEVTNEPQENMEGTCKYYVGDGDTTATLRVRPFSTDFFSDWDTGTFKVFRMSKRAAAEGQVFGITFPRAEIAEMPTRGTSGEKSTVDFMLRAHRNTSDIGTTELARAQFCICIG